MPQRDYIARKNNQGNRTNKTLILVIVFLLLIISGLGLWLLKANAPSPTMPVQQNQPTPQITLPTPPQETWSYIRELESRNVPVDNNQKSQAAMAQLTEEQLRLAEQKRQQTKQIIIEPVTQPEPAAPPTKTVTTPTQDQVAQQQAEAAKQAEEAKRLAEERRKQAERRKQEAAQKAELAKAEQAKAEQQKATKPTEAKTVETKTAETKPKSSGRFGLQCGAYKNKAQAENMQARLAMAGYNARINVSADWNRVVVGPIGDRAAATRAHANARSVAECVVVAM